MTPNQLFSLPSSFDSYIRHGWALVPIPHGTKGPRNPNWNHKENCLTNSAAIPPGHGVGLAHAYSGTMALDIDDWDGTASLLSQHGIDLQSLYDAPDAVQIISGNPGHGKLLYAMPFGATLPSKKVNVDNKTVYELRCGTQTGLTVQDVLPPSVHPSTQRPYQWGGKGDWNQLPTIPDALLALWSSLLDADKQVQQSLTPKTADSVHWHEIKSALYAIPADCSRDEWVQVGMALHSAAALTNNDQEGFQIWYDWSAGGGDKFKGLTDLSHQWRSFKQRDDGITLGSLFHIAQQHGWVQPRQDVQHLFKPTTRSVEDFMADLQLPMPKANLELFPQVLRQRALEVSVSTGCDPLLPIWAGMATASAAIDKRSRLRIVDDFEVPPVLWVMCIADPAEMKSPGSAPMFDILKKLDKEDHPRYRKDKLLWEAQEAAYSASKTAYIKAASDPNYLLAQDDPNALPPVAPEPPPAPAPLRLMVEDITSQKLARMAGSQQRGLFCKLEEMASWVNKICNPSSGEDRSTWTKAFDASHHTVDRVGEQNAIQIESFAIAMYGNIQPAVYTKGVKMLQEDGLLQRFIPIPLKNSVKLSQPIPSYLQNIGEWEDRIRAIHNLPIQTYTLDSDAYDVFRDFQAWHLHNKGDEYLLGSDPTFMQSYGKLTGLCGRLAFVLHVLTSPYTPSISAYTMQQAVSLIRSYIIPSYRYMTGNAKGHNPLALDMFRIIVQLAPERDTVKPVDFQRSLRNRLEGITGQKLKETLEIAAYDLEESGYLALLPGVKWHSLEWAINPILRTDAGFDQWRKRIVKSKAAKMLEFEQGFIARNGVPSGRYQPAIGLSPDEDVTPERYAHDGIAVPLWGGLGT